jgi:hypothetical protein
MDRRINDPVTVLTSIMTYPVFQWHWQQVHVCTLSSLILIGQATYRPSVLFTVISACKAAEAHMLFSCSKRYGICGTTFTRNLSYQRGIGARKRRIILRQALGDLSSLTCHPTHES